MLSDIEIAKRCKMRDIGEIAAKLGVDEDSMERYGKYKAKLSVDFSKRKGKLILVTAINPTASGEGKTTVSIGLADGMARLGKKVCLALREPSLGPVFGIKGGAAGGGYAQVVPMEDINLHFTGDLHAITAANNLLGFLYVSVNSITQACMSFTSQNYGAGKTKRMDRVLIDCLILSCAFSLTMGCCAWFFGPQLLQIYTESSAVISCGVEILSFTTVTYFLCGIMDLIPGALRGMGRSAVPMILSIIGTVGTRIVWIFWIFPYHRSLDILFLSYPVSWILTILMQVICFFIVRKSVHADMKTL